MNDCMEIPLMDDLLMYLTESQIRQLIDNLHDVAMHSHGYVKINRVDHKWRTIVHEGSDLFPEEAI